MGCSIPVYTAVDACSTLAECFAVSKTPPDVACLRLSSVDCRVIVFGVWEMATDRH